MIRFKFFLLQSSLIILYGCATSSKVCQDISLGITTQEVIRSSGKPFCKNACFDVDGNLIEEWSYKETTWDDGGWSWDRTIVTTVVVFENNKLKSFNNTGERFKTKNPLSPSLNINTTTHRE